MRPPCGVVAGLVCGLVTVAGAIAQQPAAQPFNPAEIRARDPAMLSEFRKAREELRLDSIVRQPDVVLTDPQLTTPVAPEQVPPQVGFKPEFGKVYQIKPDAVNDAKIWAAVRDKLSVTQPDPSNPDAGAPVVEPVPIPGVFSVLSANGKTLRLKAYLLSGDPLRRTAEGSFNGTFNIAVSDIDQIEGDGAKVDFSAPIHFSILNPASTDPDSGSLNDSVAVVPIEVIAPGLVENVEIRVRTPFDPAGQTIRVPLAELLQVSTAAPSIEGFGLEATTVHVSLFGKDHPEGAQIELSANAYLDSDTLKLDGNGKAQTKLRARGIGPTRITATAGLMSAEKDIDATLPFLTVVSSLLGGLVGGGLRALTGRSKVGLPKKTLIGVLVGVLVFALYAVGVNILPVTPVVTVGPVVVFALSGLAAFLGPALLNLLQKKPPGT